MIEYHIDGYTIGKNPSSKGGGFTIKGRDGFLFTHRILLNPTSYKTFTNNEGELLAAVFGAAMAPQDAILVTDGRNTEAWLKSGNPKARPDLKWLCQLGREIIKSKNQKLQWRPRGVNLAGQHNEFELGV